LRERTLHRGAQDAVGKASLKRPAYRAQPRRYGGRDGGDPDLFPVGTVLQPKRDIPALACRADDGVVHDPPDRGLQERNPRRPGNRITVTVYLIPIFYQATRFIQSRKAGDTEYDVPVLLTQRLRNKHIWPVAPRLVLPGIPHHVTLRGSGRQQIFFEDGD
jgi:hypothetical protein